jgi:hypothetical protein
MNYLLDHAHFNLYVSAFFLGLAGLLILFLLGVICRAAWCWIRFEKVCGGYKAAMNVLEAAEIQFVTDGLMKRGMKYAQKLGWLT